MRGTLGLSDALMRFTDWNSPTTRRSRGVLGTQAEGERRVSVARQEKSRAIHSRGSCVSLRLSAKSSSAGGALPHAVDDRVVRLDLRVEHFLAVVVALRPRLAADDDLGFRR